MVLLMLRRAAAACFATCAALLLLLLPAAPSSSEQSSVSTSDAARFFFLPLPAEAAPFLAELLCKIYFEGRGGQGRFSSVSIPIELVLCGQQPAADNWSCSTVPAAL
jgi:hypothetical protein